MWDLSCAVLISIHAPREGSDPGSLLGSRARRPFLSTLPARGATPPSVSMYTGWGFLSTLPARGATRPRAAGAHTAKFLSTLPARGATLGRGKSLSEALISIHAPREGSDG